MDARDLAAVLEAHTTLNNHDSRAAITALLKAMRSALLAGQPLRLRHIGTLQAVTSTNRNLSGLKNIGSTSANGTNRTLAMTPSRNLVETLRETTPTSAPSTPSSSAARRPRRRAR